MSFTHLYRISTYVMLFLATLVLNVDMGRDFPLAPLYPIVFALAAAIAFVTVDRDPRLGLPRPVANALALASIALCTLEYRYDPNILVLAIGHWLVFLQLIMIFLPKTVADDWLLMLLGLTQALVGAFQPGEWAGPVLLAWVLATLWTLGLFHLHRESLRAEPSRPERDTADDTPLQGIVELPFLASALNVAALTLALGGLIFLVMPRWQGQGGRRAKTAPTQHLTGFSDSVRLGQMGEILESDTVVMTVELRDEHDRRIEPPPEALWRGVVLQRYQDGQWFRSRNVRAHEFLDWRDEGIPEGPTIRQDIKLEQSDTDVLFGLRPIHRAEGQDLALNLLDGTIYRFDMRPGVSYLVPMNRHPGTYSYSVVSLADPKRPQTLEMLPANRRGLLQIPEALQPRLERIARPVIGDIPEEDVAARAEALERYLRDGEFTYTLRMGQIDPSLDPVEDFLLNRKEGHCEYFASALALMLRSVGIPARMVNGFKGGDWTALANIQYVRQKHAHSWVEVLVGEDEDGRPQWKTLDPTPAREREATVARVGGLASRMHFATDYVRYLWVFYITGFDADRQNRLIYRPIRNLLEEAYRGFGVMWRWLRNGVAGVLGIPTLDSASGLKGFLLNVVVTVVPLMTLALIWWFGRSLLERLRRPREESADQAAGLAAYRRLVAVLGKLGLSRPAAETPREFARRAGVALGGHGTALSEVPRKVVDVFYDVRFGGGHLQPETAAALEAGLDELEAAIGPSP